MIQSGRHFALSCCTICQNVTYPIGRQKLKHNTFHKISIMRSYIVCEMDPGSKYKRLQTENDINNILS